MVVTEAYHFSHSKTHPLLLEHFSWYTLSGPMGAFLLKHDFYFNILNPLRYFLYYAEESEYPGGRDLHAGPVGSVGFEVFNIEEAAMSDRIGPHIQISSSQKRGAGYRFSTPPTPIAIQEYKQEIKS